MKIVDLVSLARFITSSECKSIIVLTGAGVSVSSGIPDFRSPGGMYDSLKPERITASKHEQELMTLDPTYVIMWDIFKHNQLPYMEVRRPFILGTQNKQWKATIAHRFFELLHIKTNKLKRIYTQNIDGLDHQASDIPKDKIVNVHGTLATASCEGCKEPVSDYSKFCNDVRTKIKNIYYDNEDLNKDAPKESTTISCEFCGMPLIKPDSVLFGRSLPQQFFNCVVQDLSPGNVEDDDDDEEDSEEDTTDNNKNKDGGDGVDLLIIAGTSLLVSPANSLVYSVPETTKRVIVNREPVGIELGIQYDNANNNNDNNNNRDYFAQGDCDEIFLKLIQHLGWFDDLYDKIDLLPDKSADLVRTTAIKMNQANKVSKATS